MEYQKISDFLIQTLADYWLFFVFLVIWVVCAWRTTTRSKKDLQQIHNEMKRSNEQAEQSARQSRLSAEQYAEQARTHIEQWNRQLALLERIAGALENIKREDR